MSDYNLFPDFPKWFWMLLIGIFFLGVATLFGGLIYGIVYLCYHIKFV